LVVYFPFNGDALDASGNENNGDLNNVDYALGKIGEGLSFGGSGHLTVEDAASLSLGEDYSVAMWINPASISGQQPIFERGTGESSRILIWLEDDEVSMGTNSYWSSSAADLEIGNWYHVVAVHSGEGDIERIYVDGVKISEKIGEEKDAYNSGTFFLGVDAVYRKKYYYKGMLDEFRIYNRALTEKEVKELFKYRG
jgi:hypothetical protein